MTLTIKQEKFAQYFIDCGNASEAYRRAYDVKSMSAEAIYTEAWKLQQHPGIAQRIETLKQQLSQRHEVTRETIAAELEEARQLALAEGQAGAAATAAMGKAKLYGLLVDKQEVKAEGMAAPKPDLEEMLAKARAAGALDSGTTTAQSTDDVDKSAAITTH